jgi:putative hemolysin
MRRTPTARIAPRRILVAALGLATVLAGCARGGGDDGPPGVPGGRPGLANPASVNCLALGGTLEIVDGPDGQVGWCTLPDGRRVEEWELYRETRGG